MTCHRCRYREPFIERAMNVMFPIFFGLSLVLMGFCTVMAIVTAIRECV